ncbi:MAG: hypothetical protein HRT87_10475 [Legionellales bacterium]|nr:hypothetical protein [Legionellales bacterium]
MNIVLVGLKNSGKTTFGANLAKDKDLKFIDLDDVILKSYNTVNKKEVNKISHVYKVLGKDAFRELESAEILKHMMIKKTVFATGGGSVINQQCLPVLRNMGRVFYLYLSEDEFISRVMSDSNETYLQNLNLESIYKLRHGLCQQIADCVVDVSDRCSSVSYKKILQSM